jgi:hypothetical protein
MIQVSNPGNGKTIFSSSERLTGLGSHTPRCLVGNFGALPLDKRPVRELQLPSGTEVNELSYTSHSPSSFIAFPFLLSYTSAKLIACFRCTFACSSGCRNETGGNLRKLEYTSSRQYRSFWKWWPDSISSACLSTSAADSFLMRKFYVNFKFMDMAPYRNSETSWRFGGT